MEGQDSRLWHPFADMSKVRHQELVIERGEWTLVLRYQPRYRPRQKVKGKKQKRAGDDLLPSTFYLLPSILSCQVQSSVCVCVCVTSLCWSFTTD